MVPRLLGERAGVRASIHQRNAGVALVITLIFLAVITFMAVTFLVVTRRERERSITQTSQSDAKFGADVALEHAKAQMIASMLARNNSYDLGLFVSTNYINANVYGTNGALIRAGGFDPTLGNAFPDNITNVSYTYLGGGQVAGKDIPKLMSNLRILPRVPVYVSTNRNPAFPPDFRFYLDLNRNGVYDTNGFGFQYSNNVPIVVGGVPLMANYVGDPEWIGILNHPELSHSASNLFIARYAYIAIPIGNTLDLNYIHNQAKQPSRLRDGFLRNEGFGSWELNLAGFLHYLNPDTWTYTYANADLNTINTLGPSSGTAFQDATSFLIYRYTTRTPNGNWPNLANFNLIYGKPGFNAFPFDYIDVYSQGPLWTTAHSPTNYPVTRAVLNTAWSGADNPLHFFSHQDLFNFTNSVPNNLFLGQVNPSSPSNFVDRLNALSFNTNNSDQRYTFYKLLSQAAFESAPETNNKINLNYASLGGTSAGSYTPWVPVQFFTNAATRLLQTLGPPYPTNLSTAFIPVWPTNVSLYDSAVHRMLQVAANIYDATTNRHFRSSTTNFYPSVFRPTFGRTNLTVGTSNVNVVYISGYEEVTNLTSVIDPYWLAKPLSLPEDINQLQNNTATNHANIYGVPWIVGAKKGLPNFNQFGFQSMSHITRRLNIDKTRSVTNRKLWTTNQMYVIGVSNTLALDAWNSYSAAYPRSLNLSANDDLRMTFSVFNSNAIPGSTPIYTTSLAVLQPLGPNQSYFSPVTNMAPGAWAGFRGSSTPGNNNPSFQSYRSNVVFIPDMQYSVSGQRLIPTNSSLAQFEPLGTTVPHFVLGVTNRLRMVILDNTDGGDIRVLDYVQFGGADSSSMDSTRDLTAELTTYNPDPTGSWDQRSARGIPYGPNNQLQISLGNTNVSPTDWNNAQIHQAGAQSMANAIAGFSTWWSSTTPTNLVQEVPFTPTAQYYQAWAWQANDPLVHYTLRDINIPANQNNPPVRIVPPDGPSSQGPLLGQVGVVTSHYHPWNYNPNSTTDPGLTDMTLKDPLAVNSDAWDFPTNKFASIGQLGRVHRGTPWQTIYLKAQTNTVPKWESWTLNTNFLNRAATQPTNDWKILDLFTVAPNDNATRGRLSINQSGMAAWAAVLDGVVTLVPTNIAPGYVPLVIDPNSNDPQFQTIVNGINRQRATYPGGVFTNLGDILSVPELTTASPFLTNAIGPNAISDAVYERLPQQILSLLKVGEPRYLIYCYGQSLKPADHSVFQGAGPSFGIVTNYQVTGEVVTRAVVRVVDQTRPLPTLPNQPLNLPQRQPQIVVESFNVLPPE